ncbi:MAG TPA: Ig-like domain-containing protein, partial [Archangium sp.]|nr:Ig-like domain-containing protein [Archangium sp.]
VAPDTTAPATAITSPADGARVATSVTLQASATDDVAVTKVEFYVDSVLLATDTASPYFASWNPASASVGAHVLTTRAHDAAGNVGTSAPVTVQYLPDTVAPTVSIASPAAGSALSGTVRMVANASDDVAVRDVTFYANGVAATYTRVNGAPWEADWRTFEWDSGVYQVTARAGDTSGNAAVSAPVQMVVANSGTRYARYDSLLKVPKCAGAAAVCDSGVLLDGRGTGSAGPERNSPNSLSSSPGCIDGEEGFYHSSGGSIDSLRVTSLNGGIFAPGSQVRIDATVWAQSNYTLYLYTSNGVSPASWTLLSTLVPSGTGSKMLSATHTLGSEPVQAVRAVYRWYTTGASTCGSGSMNENDDLVFDVGLADTTAPGVWPLAPAEGAQVQGLVTVDVAAADVVGVSRVELHDGDTLVGTDAAAPYSFTWDASAAGSGAHALTARAYDAAGNVGTSTAVNVTVP